MVPNLAPAQQRFSDTWFELIGDHSLYKQFWNVSRSEVMAKSSCHDLVSKHEYWPGSAFDSPFNLALDSNEIRQLDAGIIVGNKMELWLEVLAFLLQKDRDAWKYSAFNKKYYPQYGDPDIM
jgi:hypothetical protein